MQQNEQVELLNRRRWSVIVRYRCPATWRWISNIFPLDWSSWWNLGKPSSPTLTVPATNIYQPPDHHKIKYYNWLELAFMFERYWSDSCCWREHSFILSSSFSDGWPALACFTISCSDHMRKSIWGVQWCHTRSALITALSSQDTICLTVTQTENSSSSRFLSSSLLAAAGWWKLYISQD